MSVADVGFAIPVTTVRKVAARLIAEAGRQPAGQSPAQPAGREASRQSVQAPPGADATLVPASATPLPATA